VNKILAVVLLLVGMANVSWADGPYDYASRWKSWDIPTRTAYVDGVAEGVEAAFLTPRGNPAKKPPSEEELRIEEYKMDILKSGYALDRRKVVEVMTDIYQDPANSYINTVKVFVYAQDKIEGKDISKSLEDARRRAYDLHRLMQK
jgi:hypothetical protein